MFSKALVVLVSAFLAFPPVTLAAKAGFGLTGPTYQADAQEANSLTVTGLDSGKFSLHDLGAGVVAGPGCASTFAGAGADCVQADSAEALIFLADRDDNLTSYLAGGIGAHVDAGTGNDHLAGGPADDRLSGGPGNDITDGGPGDDLLDDSFVGLGTYDPGSGDDTQQGGEDDDLIVAGPGADTIDGGPKTDTVDYSAATAPLAVSVDAGSHDDGAPGEGDTVTNVERVLAGGGADVILAGATSSVLVGGAGDDALRGGAGNDTLLGDDEAGHAGSGNDTLDGGAGADTLRGGDGLDSASYASRTTPVTVTLDDQADDGAAGEHDNVRSDVENVLGGAGDDTLTGSATANALTGGAGNDRLTGAGGSDTLDGGAGDDTLEAADGNADAIVCGAGEDAVDADASDAVAADCEHVTRPAAAPVVVPPEVLPASPAAPTAAVLLAGGTLRLVAHRRIRITLGCAAQGAPCAGRLTLSAKRTPASTSFRLPAGTIRTVTLTLAKSVAERVRRRHRLAATLTAAGTTVRVTLAA